VKEKMESRELGLILTELLLDAQDLHYGLWDEDLDLTVGNATKAQQRYTDMLLSALPPVDRFNFPADSSADAPVRILDIGCGTGHMMAQLLKKGYHVDGVSPSKALSRRVNQRLAAFPESDAKLFECRFQDFPEGRVQHRYDAALFSESFQYIRMTNSLDKLQKLLKPGGLAVICDFFKTDADGDGGPGDQSFSGGHHMSDFYTTVGRYPFSILRDDDITRWVSPNLELVNNLLMNKIRPAGLVVGQYIASNYPVVAFFSKILLRFFRKKQAKIKFKYFSGYRSKEVFERYKTYRLIVLRYQPI
jgi:SAM-dependent methyltransferase